MTAGRVQTNHYSVRTLLLAGIMVLPAAAAQNAGIFGTRGSSVYHSRECGSGKRIAAARRVTFESEEAAVAAGRHKCRLCARLDAVSGAAGKTAATAPTAS